MSSDVFDIQANIALIYIVDTIEAQDLEGFIDLDHSDTTIELRNNSGVFVINKHIAAQEIWLASPISGPHHFLYRDGQWVSRQNIRLFDVLSRELGLLF